MPAEQLNELDAATLQAMASAVKRSASGRKHQIENAVGGGLKLTPAQLAEKRRDLKALQRLENILIANTNQVRIAGYANRSQEARRGK